MNNNQIDIVLQYLKLETNHAIIINGQYGVGKTYFYKNELAPQIEKTSLPQNELKKFTPIHISLFGLKNIEEIQTAIFLELYPILKNKGLKLAIGVGKSLIRGMAQITKLGDIDKYITDQNLEVGDWLKYDELVICFDDLDRKSNSLLTEDIFGFINSLVENQGAKILIIANEEILRQDDNYLEKAREKVIGASIQYTPDPQLVFQKIIETRYSSSNKLFFNFLSQNEKYIIDVIKANQNNFRNLIFFLEYFKLIFSELESIFQSDKNFAIQKNDKLDAVLNFTLAISIEYKLGLLNSSNFDQLHQVNLNSLSIYQKLLGKTKSENPEQEEELSYMEKFRKKYFLHQRYFFFRSILEYITGIRPFTISELKSELEVFFPLENGKISEQNQVLKKLEYMDCLKLTNREYRNLTYKMIHFVDQGKYQLPEIQTVFHFATRFNNILKFDIEKLKLRFKKGITKGKPNYKFHSDLEFHMSISNDIEFKDDVKEIITFCLEINNWLNEKRNENKLNKIFQIFLTDFNLFLKQISDHENEWYYHPFWHKLDLNQVVLRISKLENDEIWNLAHYFKRRYGRHIDDELVFEKEFVNQLHLKIDSPKNRKISSLHNVSLDFLSKCLRESESNFPD